MDVSIYCLTFNNPERKKKMMDRFEQVGVPANFVDPMDNNDLIRKEIEGHTHLQNNFRVLSCIINHLTMMKMFLEGETNHGIFCEDDIYLRKSFKDDLPDIIRNFDRLSLDILLLGYLLPLSPRMENCHYKLKEQYTYHQFPDDTWGTQMYMLSRKQAEYFVNKYTLEFAKSHPEVVFAADWTLTKDGNRALIYPMVAVEEGGVSTSHQGQIDFHRTCAAVQYQPEKYV